MFFRNPQQLLDSYKVTIFYSAGSDILRSNRLWQCLYHFQSRITNIEDCYILYIFHNAVFRAD